MDIFKGLLFCVVIARKLVNLLNVLINQWFSNQHEWKTRNNSVLSRITGNLKRPRPLLKSNFSDVFFRDLQVLNIYPIVRDRS